MQGAEGKLFTPLAFTKTFALLAAVWLSLTALPALAHCVFGTRLGRWAPGLWAVCGLGVALALSWWVGLLLIAIGTYHLLAARVPERVRLWVARGVIAVAAVGVVVVLAEHWLPLGPEKGGWRNFIFAAGLIGGLLALFRALQHVFPRVLRWCLDHKGLALLFPLLLTLAGASAWLGFARVFGFMPSALRHSAPFAALDEALPGLGKEFMPPLDEGSFLWMPTTMPHASIGEVLDVLQKQNAAISQIPEVESAVGKLGRAESPLDPAPISMIETVINYRAEYLTDEDGRRRLFAFDEHATDLFRDSDGSPSSAPDGEPYKVPGPLSARRGWRSCARRRGAAFSLVASALGSRAQSGARPLGRGYRGPTIYGRRSLGLARSLALLRRRSCSRLPRDSSCCRAGCARPWALRSKGPVWRPSSVLA